MSEKKKGFWSWLSFGKKEEITEQVSQEQTIETDSQNIAENAPFVEEKHEIVSEFIEQKLDEAKHFVEEKLDVAEHIIEELEEKIEQSFEEEKEESVAIIDTAHHNSNENLQADEIAEDIATMADSLQANEIVEETQLETEVISESEQAIEISEEIVESVV